MRNKIKTWALRLFLGLLVLLAIGYLLRSNLLPARTAGLFLDFAEGEEWRPAPQNALFEGGDIEFAGFDPVQLAGVDMGQWDEMVIVSFASKERYQTFLQRIAAQQGLARYHLSLLKPGYEQRLFANWMMRRDRNNKDINVGDQASIAEAIPDSPDNPQYADRWKKLFAGGYRGEIVMLNFIGMKKGEEGAAVSGSGSEDAKAREAEQQYSKKATRILGRMGAQLAHVGDVEQVVVGPEHRRHDKYGFARYPSVDAFEVVFTARERLAVVPIRNSAMIAERSAGYWLKPYDEFKLGAQNP